VTTNNYDLQTDLHSQETIHSVTYFMCGDACHV